MILTVYKTAECDAGPCLFINTLYPPQAMPDHPQGGTWLLVGSWSEATGIAEPDDADYDDLLARGYIVVRRYFAGMAPVQDSGHRSA